MEDIKDFGIASDFKTKKAYREVSLKNGEPVRIIDPCPLRIPRLKIKLISLTI